MKSSSIFSFQLFILFIFVSLHGKSQILIPTEAGLSEEYSSFMCLVKSDRNKDIPKFSDLSKYAPENYRIPGVEPDKEIWFPAIDIELEKGMELEVSFEGFRKSDSVCWNGNLTEDCRNVSSTISYTNYLEHWENQLYINSSSVTVTGATIKFPIQASNEYFVIKPLADDWSGSITIMGQSNGEWTFIRDTIISLHETATSTKPVDSFDEKVLHDRLQATLSFILRSQNRNPLSPYYGGLYLIYDFNTSMFRRSDWVWSYGPSIKLLTESSQIDYISKEMGYEHLLSSARLLAESSLRFQVLEEGHPAKGLVVCRYDPRMDTPHGSEGFCSPADSYFLAGWGWLPYYQQTKDERFLEAGKLMTREMERILSYDEIVEQDYLMKAEKWKNWTMDESGFGMKGAEAVYKATENENFKAIGKDYISGLLKYLEREDGLWDRTWHRNEADRADNGWGVGAPRGEPVLITTKYSTRGLGWAMIGLLASHGMMPTDGYLEKAEKMANILMKYQQPEGYWPFIFKGGNDEVQSVKGTTLWCLLFYELYQYTRNEEHLKTARNALKWCLNQQIIESSSMANGGIPEITSESGVVYCRWNKVICSYAMAWYGLALMEELKIQQSE